VAHLNLPAAVVDEVVVVAAERVPRTMGTTAASQASRRASAALMGVSSASRPCPIWARSQLNGMVRVSWARPGARGVRRRNAGGSGPSPVLAGGRVVLLAVVVGVRGWCRGSGSPRSMGPRVSSGSTWVSGPASAAIPPLCPASMSAWPRMRPLIARVPSLRRTTRSSSVGSGSSSGAIPSASSLAISAAATRANPRGVRVAACSTRNSSASVSAAGSMPGTRSR
jgi:hypothetical protein